MFARQNRLPLRRNRLQARRNRSPVSDGIVPRAFPKRISALSDRHQGAVPSHRQDFLLVCLFHSLVWISNQEREMRKFMSYIRAQMMTIGVSKKDRSVTLWPDNVAGGRLRSERDDTKIACHQPVHGVIKLVAT